MLYLLPFLLDPVSLLSLSLSLSSEESSSSSEEEVSLSISMSFAATNALASASFLVASKGSYPFLLVFDFLLLLLFFALPIISKSQKENKTGKIRKRTHLILEYKFSSRNVTEKKRRKSEKCNGEGAM